jgi:methionyl-tRNA synthetase
VLVDAAILLSPILLDLSRKMIKQLGLEEKHLQFAYLEDDAILASLHVNKPEILLKRLDVKEETAFLDALIYQ